MDRAMEWRVECPNCGTFNYVGPEPVTCPKCQSVDIDTLDRELVEYNPKVDNGSL